MSRGHGAIQRQILEHVTDEWIDVGVLAMRLRGHGDWLERSELESCRRACKRLAAEGLLELGYLNRYGLGDPIRVGESVLITGLDGRTIDRGPFEPGKKGWAKMRLVVRRSSRNIS